MCVVVQDDGNSLLHACLDGDWGKAADLIVRGSNLEGRSKVCMPHLD